MKKYLQGFSLLETIIVLTLISVIAGLGLLVSLSFYNSYNFKNEQNLLVGLLQKARSQAMNNVNQSPHGLHIDAVGHHYVLFQGNSYAERNIAEDLTFPANSNYSLSSSTDVIFTPLSGTTTASSNIFQDNSQHFVKIILNHEGKIDIQ